MTVALANGTHSFPVVRSDGPPLTPSSGTLTVYGATQTITVAFGL
ncbi:MAG: hypothetical protein WA719_04235 [Thermoplasmata archaeon]